MANYVPDEGRQLEVPQFMYLAQKERELEKARERASKVTNFREYNSTKRRKRVKVSKGDLILLTVATGLTLSVMVRDATDAIVNLYQHQKGAKIVTERLVEQGNFPENLDIDYLDEVRQYDVSYRTFGGERVKRENVNIDYFVQDIYASALDNGATPEELATAFVYSGLNEGIVEKLIGTNSEQIEQCKMENYYQWSEQEKEIGSRGKL